MDDMNEKRESLEQLTQRISVMIAESQDPEYTEYLHKMDERIRQQRKQEELLKAEMDRSYEMYLRRMQLNESKKEAAKDDVDVQVVVEEQQSVMNAPQHVINVPQKKRSAEFTIGAAVLSIIGGGFILAALVTLGMTFMDGLFKGICLYAVALLFLLVSEVYVYRRWPMIGATFSAIGIGGLYLSTAVNFLGLHNFNLWVTLIIALAITVFVLLLSRRRDSVLYRIIGMLAGYMCFLVIQEGITDVEFYMVSGLSFLMNVLCIIMPLRKYRAGIQIAHVGINSFFAICFVLRALFACNLEKLPVLVFVISSITIMQILLVAQCVHYKKNSDETCNVAFLTLYHMSSVSYLIMTSLLAMEWFDSGATNWYAYGTAIVLAVVALVAMLILSLKKCSGHGHIYTFLNLMLFFLIGMFGEDWVYVITVLIMLVVVKIICMRYNEIVYRVNDILITLLLCFSLDISAVHYSYVLLGGVVFSILMIKYWPTVYEIGLTTVLVIYTAKNLPYNLNLPVIVGLLLVLILLFNSAKKWQGKNIKVFNILALVTQGICFLRLSASIYQGEYLTYFCMLIFGLATIVLTLQEKYHMNYKGKYLILALFLTYMVFIFKMDIPVINSIILMIIALVCVGVGFAVDNKSVRIYGLVLSLVVCGKMVLYDFFGTATIQKTILFFAVGVIALIIAGIYIILEKKSNTEEK